MELTQIKYEQDGAIARITLNRPNKLNALTEVMLSEWRSVLTEIARDTNCRVVVVSGAGRAWSAGVDLSVFQHTKVEPGYPIWDDGMEIMRLLENMPQVTIAMLNGFCFTGAMEIMMAFDLVIAAEEAKIGDTHTKWGIPPKWGMTQRLMNLVGIRKAKELSFTAKTIKGAEAARIGLVNSAVPLVDLANVVEELATKIIGNSAQTIAAVK
ncbi:MAG: enoyl-CoA hydratase/isomerase family protein, partial [Chitinophagales bacterium]